MAAYLESCVEKITELPADDAAAYKIVLNDFAT
jgi:hypothetical protein